MTGDVQRRVAEVLAGDGPVAGGNGALSAPTGAAGHPDQDEAAGAQE